MAGACNVREAGQWIYDDDKALIRYELNDSERSRFNGICRAGGRSPAIFFLHGGRHNPMALAYDIEVDGRKWHIGRKLVPHDGPSLDFHEPDIVAAIGNAAHEIIVSEGQWRRVIPADAQLRQFWKDCLDTSGREVHPDRPISMAAVNLDNLLTFETPRECIEGPVLAQLLQSMLVTTGDYRLIGGKPFVPAAYQAALGSMSVETVSGVHQATLALRGSWHGLPVKSLQRYAMEESDYGGFEISFTASRSRLLSAVNAVGFDLPQSGERSLGEEVVTTITVTGNDKASTLTCHIG